MRDPEIRQEDTALDFSIGIQKADRMGFLLVSLPKWIAWAVIAWQIRLSVQVLSGEHAFPSLLTRFWRQASIWEVVCWGTGMLGLIFGLHSRHLLHRKVARDFSRLNSIEKKLDIPAAGERNET